MRYLLTFSLLLLSLGCNNHEHKGACLKMIDSKLDIRLGNAICYPIPELECFLNDFNYVQFDYYEEFEMVDMVWLDQSCEEVCNTLNQRTSSTNSELKNFNIKKLYADPFCKIDSTTFHSRSQIVEFN